MIWSDVEVNYVFLSKENLMVSEIKFLFKGLPSVLEEIQGIGIKKEMLDITPMLRRYHSLKEEKFHENYLSILSLSLSLSFSLSFALLLSLKQETWDSEFLSSEADL